MKYETEIGCIGTFRITANKDLFIIERLNNTEIKDSITFKDIETFNQLVRFINHSKFLIDVERAELESD